MAKAKYSEGEKILCFHGPLLYEAKCLQVDVKEGQMKYFVHYQGWNKNWDEWVTDARMMKFNAVGLQKQKELKDAFAKPGGKKLRKAELQRQAYPLPESLRHLEEHMPTTAAASPLSGASASISASTSASAASESADPSAAAAAAVAEPEASSIGPPQALSSQQPPVLENMAELHAPQHQQQQQQQHQSASLTRPSATPPPPTLQPGSAAPIEAAPSAVPLAAAAPEAARKRPAPMPRLRVSLPLSDRLRDWLADDQDLVINQCKLLRLPAGPRATVVAIAGDYAEISSPATGADFASGLVGLFNACLGCRLLYKFERPQYAGLLRSQKSALPAGVYGAAHLLRLLACLPDLLPLAGLPAESAAELLDECRRFLIFLDARFDSYLSVDSYEVATPDYQRLALCI